MLTLTRMPLRQAGRSQGRYRAAALVLLQDGELLGEVLVTEVVIDPFTGRVDVRLGLNLPSDIHAVRADAVERPEGPSHEWLRAREQYFDVPVAPAAPPVGAVAASVPAAVSVSDGPSASSARYVFRPAHTGDLLCDPNDSYASSQQSSPTPRPSGRRSSDSTDRRWE